MEQKIKRGISVKNLSDTSYLPVAWEYREVIEEAMEQKTAGKVFYFCEEEGICEALGKVARMNEIDREGLFIIMDNGMKIDRKSTRLNSSHVKISYAVFCLKQK